MPLNQNDLYFVFNDENEAIKFCFFYKLIDENRACLHQDRSIQMILQINTNFKCNLCFECPECHRKESIFKNTIFSNSKLKIGTILKIVYYWVYEYSCKSTMNECNISDNTVTNFNVTHKRRNQNSSDVIYKATKSGPASLAHFFQLQNPTPHS